MTAQMPLRAGLVGCGQHGSSLAQAIARSPSLRLVACADPDVAAASRAAANGADVSTHVSVEALLAECDVDAVVVATPHHLLAPVALAAIRAGKHVLAEKPIALDAAQAAEVEREVEHAGICYMAGYSFRFSMFRHVHELLAAGAVGEIVALTASIETGPFDAGWTAYPETGGGPLLYVGCHIVDLALWCLEDEPTEVFAHLKRRPDTDADDTTTLQVRFARGALAQCFVTQSASGFWYGVEIRGRKGRVTLRGRNFLQFEIEVSSNALPAYAEPTIIRPSMRRDNIQMMLVPELEEFAAAIRERRPPAITAADGRRVLQLLDAAVESGRSGSPTKLIQ
jgi:predicted dehydrogenase